MGESLLRGPRLATGGIQPAEGVRWLQAGLPAPAAKGQRRVGEEDGYLCGRDASAGLLATVARGYWSEHSESQCSEAHPPQRIEICWGDGNPRLHPGRGYKPSSLNRLGLENGAQREGDWLLHTGKLAEAEANRQTGLTSRGSGGDPAGRQWRGRRPGGGERASQER